MNEERRMSRCEFNPDPDSVLDMHVELKLYGHLGDVGTLKVKTTRTRVFGPDWKNLLEEVFLAVRGQLAK